MKFLNKFNSIFLRVSSLSITVERNNYFLNQFQKNFYIKNLSRKLTFKIKLKL